MVCRKGKPDNTLIVWHVWIAVLFSACWQPPCPDGFASQAISASNQIDSKPRCFRAVLLSDQFGVLYVVGVQLLLHASYHAGFIQ